MADDDEDQIMDVKLALLDLALWSNNEYRASRGQPLEARDDFAVVTLESSHYLSRGGMFAFPKHNKFYRTRKEAFDAALKLAADGEERIK